MPQSGVLPLHVRKWYTSHTVATLMLGNILLPTEEKARYVPEFIWTPWRKEKSVAPNCNQTTIPWLSSLQKCIFSTEGIYTTPCWCWNMTQWKYQKFVLHFSFQIVYQLQHSVFLLSVPWSLQLSQDVAAVTGFLCDEPDVLSHTIKERPHSLIWYRSMYFNRANHHTQYEQRWPDLRQILDAPSTQA